jgi:hypothetical protein
MSYLCSRPSSMAGHRCVRSCRFSLAADLPMSVLSVYYLTRAMNECIVSADAHRVPSDELVVCGLTAGPATVINVLSAVTSAALVLCPPPPPPATPPPSAL